MSNPWEDSLFAYLYEISAAGATADDRLDVTCDFCSIALGRPVGRSEVEEVISRLSRTEERLLPAGLGNGLAVTSSGHIDVCHPLSGDRSTLLLPTAIREAIRKELDQVTAGLEGPEKRFLAIWRLLSGRLASQGTSYDWLPADWLIPDSSIWQRANQAAGWAIAGASEQAAAVLVFSLGPVQRFIEAARSTRDLWSGSMILSWLTFQGMLPVLRKLGPAAFVFPSLRGIPFLDRYLRNEHGLALPLPDSAKSKSPCLPNRFLAIVPADDSGEENTGRKLAKQCEGNVQNAWKTLGETVRGRLRREFASAPHSRSWDALWDEQVDDFFEVTTALLPLKEASEEAIARVWQKENLAEVYPALADICKLQSRVTSSGELPSNPVGLWQAQVDLANRLLAARRSMRKLPHVSLKSGKVPAKCTLMGNYEQMGPSDRAESAGFWESVQASPRLGERIRKRERLCAISLVKRFGPRHFLREELEISHDSFNFPDTATVAAGVWLQRHQIEWQKIENWSGQWLHRSRREHSDESDDQDDPPSEEIWRTITTAKKQERPPTYYAILMLDGDEMGAWLQGEKTPVLGQILHERLRDKLGSNKDIEEALKARRPVSPTLHAALSEALANFSLSAVPEIVAEHHGTLIYSGGDDVLAMLPVETAVQCSLRLRDAFSGTGTDESAPSGSFPSEGRHHLMMGRTATASAGLAVVHYKEDLRVALATARRAEKRAKENGRNQLAIAVSRRSGERSIVTSPWEFLRNVDRWIQDFLRPNVSNRWTYRLRGDLPVLQELSAEAIAAEIHRQVDRSDVETRAAFRSLSDREFPDLRRLLSDQPPGAVFSDLINLCQTASFLARGRED